MNIEQIANNILNKIEDNIDISDNRYQYASAIESALEDMVDELYECKNFDLKVETLNDRIKKINQDNLDGYKFTVIILDKEF